MRTGLTLAFLLTVPLAAAAPAADPGSTRDAYVATTDPLGEPVQSVVYLNQGWSASRSLEFYFTAQGSQIIPYSWFLALEQADSSTPFRDAQNMLRYRYLPQLPDGRNPDGLPIGFVADDPSNPIWLGLTCAACHTNEIRYKNTGYRIDGAPTQADVRALLSGMIASLQKTLTDPAKFDRFAAQVLRGRNNPTAQALLKKQIAAEIDERVNYNLRNFPGYNPNVPPPPPADYGRLDAFGAIINEVYFHAEKPPALPTATSKPADAPVSYPFLWDTPGQNLVQWVGLPNGGLNSLARNVGEVLGVFGNYKVPDDHLVFGYPSSVKVLSLLAIEDWVKELRAPRWPADFPSIDQAAANRGRTLYQDHCLKCHVLIDPNGPNSPNTAIMSGGGTDPKTYNNIFTRTGPSGKLEGTFENVVNITSFDKIPSQAGAITMVTNEVIGTILGNWMQAPTDEVSRIDMRKLAPVVPFAEAVGPKYKARALDGIWATAPYLHNGSVPNLYELLLPAAKRSKSFSVGVKTFDPERVGYVTDAPGFPKFDTTAVSSSNAGHEYGTQLSDDERHALLEYLKSL